MRWNSPNEHGETKAEFNARFNQEVPDPPEVPHNVSHVWLWFHELSTQRHSGPEAIGWGELEAWCRLTQNEPTPQEVQMLIALDRAYLKAVRKEQREQMERRQEEAKKAGRTKRSR